MRRGVFMILNVASLASFASCLEDMTMIGARNTAVSREDMEDTTIIGSHLRALNSTDSLMIGHNASISNSQEVVAIGNEIHIREGANLMAIGHDLLVKGSREKSRARFVLGAYNAPSNASFVFANGRPGNASNVLEIFEDGSIRSQQMLEMMQSIASLMERVRNLETMLQTQQQDSNDGECSCSKIQRFYKQSGCC